MAPVHMLTLGIDYLVTFLSRFIHNSVLIRDKCPNALLNIRSTNLKVLRLDRKIERKRLKDCVVFLSASLSNVEFHSVQSYFKANQEDPIEHFFGSEDEVGVMEESEVLKAPEMAKIIERRGILRDEDVIKFWTEGNIYIYNINYPCQRIYWF